MVICLAAVDDLDTCIRGCPPQKFASSVARDPLHCQTLSLCRARHRQHKSKISCRVLERHAAYMAQSYESFSGSGKSENDSP
jgi:hypothetical protein